MMPSSAKIKEGVRPEVETRLGEIGRGKNHGNCIDFRHEILVGEITFLLFFSFHLPGSALRF
jgi:hypothetical protein